MRAYPHQPDPENQRENRADALALLLELAPEEGAAQAARRAAYYKVVAREKLSLAAYSYAFQEPAAETLDHVRRALPLFLTGVDFGMQLDPFEYTQLVCLALLLRDREAIARLAALERQRFTNPDVEAEEVVYLTAELVRELGADRGDDAEKRLAAAEAELTRRDLYPHDRDYAATLLAMAGAILRRDVAALGAALIARDEHARRLASQPAARELWASLLDFDGLGLLALAADAGLHPAVSAIYLPEELV